MGGLLAIFMAIHKPRLLGSLILNDIGPVLPWSGVFSLMTEMTHAVKINLADLNGQDLARQLRVDPALIHAVRQPGHLDLPHETRLSGVDFTASFAQVSAPILLLRGQSSEIVNDAVVKRLYGIHPLTRVVDYPNSGHPVQYSAAVCDEILRFTQVKRTP
jgi:pimeloyl-ACP methyl ester carboxylesterase